MRKQLHPGFIPLVILIIVLSALTKGPADRGQPVTSRSHTEAAISQPVQSQPHEPIPEQRYVNVDKLNVRDSPKGKTVDSKRRGEQVAVFETVAGWVRISQSNQPARWVSVTTLCAGYGCSTVSAPVAPTYSYSCSCTSGGVCIGPRGGRYCITSGGNKRYGI